MQTYRIIKKYHEGSNLIWNIYFSKLPRPHSSHTHPCFRVLLALHLCAETALSLRYSFLGFSDPQILYSGSSNEDVKFKLFFPYFQCKMPYIFRQIHYIIITFIGKTKNLRFQNRIDFPFKGTRLKSGYGSSAGTSWLN